MLFKARVVMRKRIVFSLNGTQRQLKDDKVDEVNGPCVILRKRQTVKQSYCNTVLISDALLRPEMLGNPTQ